MLYERDANVVRTQIDKTQAELNAKAAKAHAEVVETIQREPSAAYVLTCTNASCADSVVKITWGELKAAPIGTVWSCEGGGELYSEIRSAKLVFRDETLAVLEAREDYQDDYRTTSSDRLIGFRFAFANLKP
jgi:hypothetical protein